MNALNTISNYSLLKSIPHFSILIIISFSLITFVSCGSDSSTAGTDNMDEKDDPPVEQQGPNEVWMVGTTFNVSDLEVSAGTTVTWTNKSNVNHTVTSGTRGGEDEGDLFDSGTITPGGTYSYKFQDAGEYAYFCQFHSGMNAKVTVTE